jgi:hypothetical protein
MSDEQRQRAERMTDVMFCEYCDRHIYLPYGAAPWPDGRQAWYHVESGLTECFSREIHTPVAQPRSRVDR